MTGQPAQNTDKYSKKLTSGSNCREMMSNYQERPLTWLMNLPERSLRSLMNEEPEKTQQEDKKVKSSSACPTEDN